MRKNSWIKTDGYKMYKDKAKRRLQVSHNLICRFDDFSQKGRKKSQKFKIKPVFFNFWV